MLGEMLVLLKKDSSSKRTPSRVENVGLDALDDIDFPGPSENMLNDTMFDDLMSSMAADVDPSAIGNSHCQSPTDDAMFDDFMKEMGLSTVEDVETELSSDGWMDNVFSEMGTSEMINDISV